MSGTSGKNGFVWVCVCVRSTMNPFDGPLHFLVSPPTPTPRTVPSVKVNGCLMDPLPPPTVLRKSSTSSPSNMMETSIDEGIETEEPDCEDDPPQLLSAYQTARFGQRRHTLSEVTNQPGPSSQGTEAPVTLKNTINRD